MNDERLGSHYSKVLHEKGFDNIFLLSGGLEKFVELHSSCVEGANVPDFTKKAKKEMRNTKTSFKSSKI